MIRTAILNFLTRDLNAIVAFLSTLEQRIEKALEAHGVKVSALKEKIAKIEDEGKVIIQQIEDETARRVGKLETEIANSARATELLQKLGVSLPKAN